METDTTREVEEAVDKFIKNTGIVLLAEYTKGDVIGLQSMRTEIENLLHQQLQKARHDWLREEIVKLEGMRKPNIPVLAGGGSKPSEYHKAGQVNGANRALQTIIDRYQSELDQDTDCPNCDVHDYCSVHLPDNK